MYSRTALSAQPAIFLNKLWTEILDAMIETVGSEVRQGYEAQSPSLNKLLNFLQLQFFSLKRDNSNNMCNYGVDVRTKEIMYIKCLSEAYVENFTKNISTH